MAKKTTPELVDSKSETTDKKATPKKSAVAQKPESKKDNDVIIVNKQTIDELIKSAPDLDNAQPVNNGTTPNEIDHKSVENKEVILKSKNGAAENTNIDYLVNYGNSILATIKSDWRLPIWGYIPFDSVKEVLTNASAEFGYEAVACEQGAYFLIIVNNNKLRFPQKEDEFIKIR